MTDLAQIDRKKEQLDSFRPLPSALVQNLDEWFKVELTYNSNAIEGNTLTRSETALVVEKGLTVQGKPFKDHAEAINHAEAVDYVASLIDTSGKQIVTKRQLFDIHRLVLKGIDEDNAGRLRSIPVQIQGIDLELPQPYMLEKLMEDFFLWLNANTEMHPVIVAAEAHLRLVTIHPFIDGNGRTSRLLMNLLLMQAGYPASFIRKEDRTRYIESLGHAQKSGELEPYYSVILESVNRSLDIYLKAVNPKKEMGKFTTPLPTMKLLRIGELASLTGETAVTIRHWTDEGIIKAAHVTDNGYRYYNLLSVDLVKSIRHYQESERLSLPEIRKRFESEGNIPLHITSGGQNV